MTQDDAVQPSELTPRIGKVARRELALNGYSRYDQLTRVTPARLPSIHGIGPKAIRILEEELASRGLAFAGSCVPQANVGRLEAASAPRPPRIPDRPGSRA